MGTELATRLSSLEVRLLGHFGGGLVCLHSLVGKKSLDNAGNFPALSRNAVENISTYNHLLQHNYYLTYFYHSS